MKFQFRKLTVKIFAVYLWIVGISTVSLMATILILLGCGKVRLIYLPPMLFMLAMLLYTFRIAWHARKQLLVQTLQIADGVVEAGS